MKVLLEYTGILEPFQEMLQTPQEVEVIQRVKGNKKYFFVLNYMDLEQKIVPVSYTHLDVYKRQV